MSRKKHEYSDIKVYKLITLQQVRKVKNPLINALAEDIAANGLIHAISIARLTKEEFEKHLYFMNAIWGRRRGKEMHMSSYEAYDGYYYVVISGHSRLEAVKLLGWEDIECKIHHIHTSREILALQLGENIHKEINPEERAIAIVESYRLGLIEGDWQSKTQFREEMKGKFSRDIINDALVFVDLPERVQEYIFAQNVPYAVGVEIGKIHPLIVKYEEALGSIKNEAGETIIGPAVEKNIFWHYMELLTRLQKSGSIKRGKEIVAMHAKNLNDHFRSKDELQLELEGWWDEGAYRQDEERQKQLVKAYDRASQALNSLPYEYLLELFSLDTNLSGVNHQIDIEHLRMLYTKYIQSRFYPDAFGIKK